jgi:hypothetical protein
MFITSYLRTHDIIWEDKLNPNFPDREEMYKFKNDAPLSEKEYLDMITDLSRDIRMAKQRFTDRELAAILTNNAMVFGSIAELKVFLEQQAKLAPHNKKLARLARLSEDQLMELLETMEKTSLTKELKRIDKYNHKLWKASQPGGDVEVSTGGLVVWISMAASLIFFVAINGGK